MPVQKAKRRIRCLLLLGAFVGGATLYRQYRLAQAPDPATAAFNQR